MFDDGKEFFDLNGDVHNGGENQQESSGVLALRNLPAEKSPACAKPNRGGWLRGTVMWA